MVLTRIMRIALKLFLWVILILSFSCEEQGILIKCSDCITDEPLTAELDIKVDVSSTSKYTEIKIYEGNLEDSVLYSTVHLYLSYSPKVPVTINKKYTVTANYNIRGTYYTAIDSATPRVGFDETKCDSPCYFIYDKDIDLRLKYPK
jgi:hypothetical protein